MATTIKVSPYSQEIERDDRADPGGRTKCFLRGKCTRTKEYSMQKMAQSLLRTMRFTGLYFERHYQKRCFNAYQAYAAMVVVINMSGVLRALVILDISSGFSSESLLSILQMLWVGLCFLNSVSCFQASYRQCALMAFMESWENLKQHGISSGATSTKRSLCVIMVTSWLAIAANMGITAYGNFFTNRYDHIYRPLLPTNPLFLVVKIAACALMFLMSCSWIFPLSLCMYTCVIINDEMAHFNEWFKEKVNSRVDKIKSIEPFRQRHLALCRLIESADEVSSLYTAGSLVINIGITCILLYSIITDPEFMSNSANMLSYLFWLVMAAIPLVLLSIEGGVLNHAAHASLDTLHNIDVSALSTNEALQVNMFLHKLSGPPIGLSVLGMFVIDKPTILTEEAPAL